MHKTTWTLKTPKTVAAADKARQRLFVFFAHNGNFIAANFTGQ